MHTFGHPGEMLALMDIAQEYNLPVIEDAAEALGSEYQGKKLGSWGKAGVISFNGNKIITTGGGGMMVTDDIEVASSVRHWSTTAKLSHPWRFDHDVPAFNYRLPNLNAALGCAQIKYLDSIIDQKRKLAEKYFEGFLAFEDLYIFREPEYAKSNYWLNTLILDESSANKKRDLILDDLNAKGIHIRPVWTPLHKLAMYSKCSRANLAVTEDLEARIINLPSSPNLVE